MLRRTVLTGAGPAALWGLAGTRAARADTLDEVKKRGTLVVGMEAAYVPYEFFKDGKIIGYDPDIIEYFARKLGVKAQLVDTAWNGIIPALYAKKFDVIVSAMTITKERAEKVLFSMPYADASNVILLRAGEDRIKVADDLSGKIIGVQIGSAAAGIIKTFETKLKDSGKPGYSDVKQFEHYPEAYQDLLNKRIDAVVNSRSTMMGGDEGRAREVQDDPRGIRHHRLFRHGVPQERHKPAGVRQRTARRIEKTGELAKLQDKWFGGTMDTPDVVPEVLP
jgi:polar amino acid transport system substrate-binding protein